MPEYPECEKRTAVYDEYIIIAEFMDWLRGQGVVLARWHQQHESVDARLFPDHQPIEQRLAEYFGYDLKKIDAEQRQMLEEIRNGADATSTATLVE